MTNTLYRFYNSEQLLYVGITNNPPARFKNHERDKQWWDTVTSIKLETFRSRTELTKAERVAIINEHPLHNVVHNGQPVPDRPNEPEQKGLVGKYFHTTTRCDRHGARIAVWQGRIIDAPTPDVLLIQLYEWIIGEPRGQELITIVDFMAEDPILYDDHSGWRFEYEYGMLAHSHRCE